MAWGSLGWEAVAFSEIEKFPSAVLAHHYPTIPNLGDFTKIDVRQLGHVDILCGGTPCQAFSVAGLRNSLADARGNLTLSFVRLAHELAGIAEERPDVGPVHGGEQQQPWAGNGLRNIVWENVPGVLNTKDNAYGCFLGALVGASDPLPAPKGTKWPDAGMVSGPKGRASWRVLDAQFFGLAQRRKRVIVVADFGNGADPAAVLFEFESVFGNPAPSREARKDLAPTISARTKGGGGLGTDFDLDGGESMQSYVFAPEIARCVATREGSSQDFETTTMVAVGVTGDITHTLQAEGADASEDGTGRGTPIIAFDTTQITSPTNGSNPQPCDPCHPLSAGAHPPAICFSAKDYGADATIDLSPTLHAGGHTGSHANAGVMPAIAFRVHGENSGAMTGSGNANVADPAVVARCLDSSGGYASNQGGNVVLQSAVRRLTPVECERLQGFPDNYTNIPWRGKPTSPDGPRYKALGNSWAVPKFTWLGKRITSLIPPKQEATQHAA